MFSVEEAPATLAGAGTLRRSVLGVVQITAQPFLRASRSAFCYSREMNKLLAVSVVCVMACKGKSEPAKTEPAAAKPAPTEPAKAPEPSKAAETPTPTETAKPAEAKPQLALGPGESLANVDDFSAKNTLDFTADGQTVHMAVISKDGKSWARAYVGDQKFDVTQPVELTDHDFVALDTPKSGTGVVVHERDLVDRKPEAGALFAYDDQLVTWDAAAKKPVVTKKWSCDETKAKGGVCDGGL